VTSVIILLESGRQNVFTLLYREFRDDSNTTQLFEKNFLRAKGLESFESKKEIL